MLERSSGAKGVALALAAPALAWTLASCSSQPTPQQTAVNANQLHNFVDGAFNQLTPRQQRLVCRDFQGNLPDSLEIDAAAARADIVMNPGVMGLGADLPSVELATDQVLAEEC